MLRVIIALLGLATLALGQIATKADIDALKADIAALKAGNKDLVAQSFCAGQFSGKGWAYAIRRGCDGQSCKDICRGPVKFDDSQTSGKYWYCYDAFHIYDSYPVRSPSHNRVIHKLYRYAHCLRNACTAPNYCCCAVDDQ